jgi:integrase
MVSMSRLTKSAIDAARPAASDVWLWCNELPGFGVRVQPSGRKTFVCRYRTRDGHQRKHTIGRCSDLPPDRARKLARDAFGAVAEGLDPAEDRRQLKKAPLMTDLEERYMREHARPYKKPRSVIQDARLWTNRIIPELGKRKIASITKPDVLALHGSMSCQPSTANQVLALLSKAMNLAEDWGWRTPGSNPCRRVKKFRVRQRETILTHEQIANLGRTLDVMVEERAIPRSMAALVGLLLLTGCRLNEIMSARRAWIDHGRQLLLLPDSKVGQRRIALSSAALKIVDGIPKGEWLIPGRIAGTHLTHPWGIWTRIKARAGLPPETRLHDLRHTVGSIGHMAGLSQRQIATLLGHRQMVTTERYLHGYEGDNQRAADKVAEIIAGGAAALVTQ